MLNGLKSIEHIEGWDGGQAVCEGRASFAVNHNGVEGVCDEHEVLLISLLMRPGSDHGQSCEWVTGVANYRWRLNGVRPKTTQGLHSCVASTLQWILQESE